MMNRHFKTLNSKEKDAEVIISEELNKAKKSQLNKTQKVKVEDHNRKEDIIDAASKLIKVFLSEQTKLLAFSRSLDSSQEVNREENIKELSDEVKALTQQLIQNTDDIKDILIHEKQSRSDDKPI